MRSHFLLVTAACLLVSCGTASPTRTSAPAERLDPATQGTLVGSIGERLGDIKDGAGRFELVSFSLRRPGSKKAVTVSFDRPDPVLGKDPPIKDATRMAQTFRLPLVEGDYEIYRVYFAASYYPERTCSSREDFSIPIRVERGKTTYLGEFIAHGDWDKNLLGIPLLACGHFAVTDQSARDLALLRAASAETRLPVPDTPAESHFFRLAPTPPAAAER